jgi:hypothetical protein
MPATSSNVTRRSPAASSKRRARLLPSPKTPLPSCRPACRVSHRKPPISSSGGAEAEQQREQRVARLVRRPGVDDHAMLVEQGFQALVAEDGPDGREVADRRPFGGLGWVAHLSAKGALDRVPARADLGNVARLDLLLDNVYDTSTRGAGPGLTVLLTR